MDVVVVIEEDAVMQRAEHVRGGLLEGGDVAEEVGRRGVDLQPREVGVGQHVGQEADGGRELRPLALGLHYDGVRVRAGGEGRAWNMTGSIGY